MARTKKKKPTKKLNFARCLVLWYKHSRHPKGICSRPQRLSFQWTSLMNLNKIILHSNVTSRILNWNNTTYFFFHYKTCFKTYSRLTRSPIWGGNTTILLWEASSCFKLTRLLMAAGRWVRWLSLMSRAVKKFMLHTVIAKLRIPPVTQISTLNQHYKIKNWCWICLVEGLVQFFTIIWFNKITEKKTFIYFYLTISYIVNGYKTKTVDK